MYTCICSCKHLLIHLQLFQMMKLKKKNEEKDAINTWYLNIYILGQTYVKGFMND